jgi:hypothetical protein
LAAFLLAGSHAPRVFVPNSIGGASTRLARRHPEITCRMTVLDRTSSSNELRPVRPAAPDRPSGPAEIIARLLANGYTIVQIRAMFPGLFAGPQPGG